MSIKSLFENIADAIKDKNPNVTNVTPVEMPSAIRDIPTGSSTAVGVTYDNTASGLTANNVQGAIDELAGNVSAITSDLSELSVHLLYDTVTSMVTNTEVVIPSATDYDFLVYNFTMDTRSISATVKPNQSFELVCPSNTGSSPNFKLMHINGSFSQTGTTLKCTNSVYIQDGTATQTPANWVKLKNVLGFNVHQ